MLCCPAVPGTTLDRTASIEACTNEFSLLGFCVGHTFNDNSNKLALCVGGPNRQHESSVQNKTLRAGQHVRIDGRAEVYLILRVDRTRHLADLLRQGAVRKVQAGVPLALLTAVYVAAARTGELSEADDDAQFSEQAS
jgi:hypothetical protein